MNFEVLPSIDFFVVELKEVGRIRNVKVPFPIDPGAPNPELHMDFRVTSPQIQLRTRR